MVDTGSIADAITAIANWLLAAAAIATALVAANGLSTWREQLKFSFDLDISKKILSKVSESRRLLSHVAAPYYIAEDRSFLEPEDAPDTSTISMRRSRYFKARSELNELEIWLRDASIVWLEREIAAEKFWKIKDFNYEIFSKINRLSRLEGDPELYVYEERLDELHDLRSYLEDVIDGRGQFEADLNAAFAPLENYIAGKIRGEQGRGQFHKWHHIRKEGS
jgi:hypothetical protein